MLFGMIVIFSNQFSRKVNEEYLKYFEFEEMNLLQAMRAFFSHFALVGETQERERVLHHFSTRYIECNPVTITGPGAVYQSQGKSSTRNNTAL